MAEQVNRIDDLYSKDAEDNILSICFENSINNIFYTGHSNGVINKINLQSRILFR